MDWFAQFFAQFKQALTGSNSLQLLRIISCKPYIQGVLLTVRACLGLFEIGI